MKATTPEAGALAPSQEASIIVKEGYLIYKRNDWQIQIMFPEEEIKMYAEEVVASVRKVLSVPAETRTRFVKQQSLTFWPRSWKLQLLLLLLAESYPYPKSTSELESFFSERGVKIREVKKTLYEYYHYYQIVERVGRGWYKLADWYYKRLVWSKPYWRTLLSCMRNALSSHNYYVIERCESIITKAISYYTEILLRSEKVLESPIKVRTAYLYRTFEDKEKYYSKKKEKRKCDINLEKIDEVLMAEKPALYEEIKGDIDMAREIIAVLYARAKRGKPYLEIAGATKGVALATIQDEARALVGGSSRLWRVMDFDQVAGLLAQLSSAGLVFLRKYGKVYKIRIDKEFENILDEAGVCG